jgi:hypothetical protein
MSLADDDGNHDPEQPPLLDYPSPPVQPDNGDTESWFEVGRAMLVVFGVLGFLFFITFGLCGVFSHGCG